MTDFKPFDIKAILAARQREKAAREREGYGEAIEYRRSRRIEEASEHRRIRRIWRRHRRSQMGGNGSERLVFEDGVLSDACHATRQTLADAQHRGAHSNVPPSPPRSDKRFADILETRIRQDCRCDPSRKCTEIVRNDDSAARGAKRGPLAIQRRRANWKEEDAKISGAGDLEP